MKYKQIEHSYILITYFLSVEKTNEHELHNST